MNVRYFIFLIALLGFSIDSTAQNTKKAFRIKTVGNYIQEANKNYGIRFKADDSLFYQKMYTKDCKIFPAEAPAVSGRDNIRAYYYDNGNNKDMIIEITTTDLYGDVNMVVEEGVYNFPDGKGGSYDKGKFIALWKSEYGKWKLHREIWNTDIKATSN